MFAEHHCQHGTVGSGKLTRQPQQVAIVAAQAAADHIGHHRDIERWLDDGMQRQLHVGDS